MGKRDSKRYLKKGKVAEYIKAINSGVYSFAPVSVSSPNLPTMVNGQNRLRAITKDKMVIDGDGLSVNGFLRMDALSKAGIPLIAERIEFGLMEVKPKLQKIDSAAILKTKSATIRATNITKKHKNATIFKSSKI